MALSKTNYEVTDLFNANNGYVVDMSNWDSLVIQFTGSTSGTINITATNDAGDITGSVQGNSLTATNYATIQATKLSDGTSVTAISAAGLYKVGIVGQFVKFGGASAATTGKVFIYLSKIF